MRSKFYSFYFRPCLLAVVCVLPSVGHGQSLSLPIPDRTSKEWRRINTETDSTTDIGVSTLVLEPNGLFRTTFRISLSKAEEAAEKPGAKYKVRLLTIQFDSRHTAYRICETTLLDSSDKIVYASGPMSGRSWRPLVRTSQTYNTYYYAASNLSPLGVWKVTSSSNLQSTGSSGRPLWVATTMDRFEVGRNRCSTPSYESAPMTKGELSKLSGLGPDSFQTPGDKVNVVKIRCDSPNLVSEVHLLIMNSIDKALLVSGGDLFALEK
jgi:hypothetical protein